MFLGFRAPKADVKSRFEIKAQGRIMVVGGGAEPVSDSSNSAIRVIPQNGSILTDYNTSRSFAITTESPPSCIESSSQWPIFNPNLSSFTVKGIDWITFPFPTQLWQGTVQGELFSYYCTADDQQMPVGFCGRDYDSIKKCIHWINFLHINASNNIHGL